MKLKESFITYENGDDNILMDSSAKFSGLVHSNSTAAYIVECLKTETTENEIVQKMLAKYDATEEQISEGVKSILTKLRSIGAIDE